MFLPGLVQHADASQQPVIDVGHCHTDRQDPQGARVKEIKTEEGPAHVPRTLSANAWGHSENTDK